MALPLPLFALLSWHNRQPLTGFGWRAWWPVAMAGVLFALDLSSWHIGIELTRLGNAALFGNVGSLILMVWALIVARRLPRAAELFAIILAISGAAILLGRSMEIDSSTLHGDLFCILAGVFYVGYILPIQYARKRFGSWALLFYASLVGAPVALGVALLLGEPVWPHVWWPLIALSIGSQVIGQGLLVYALRHFSALIVGVVLLTQPAVSILVGWLAFRETMGVLDALGMLSVAAAIVLARLSETPTATRQ